MKQGIRSVGTRDALIGRMTHILRSTVLSAFLVTIFTSSALADDGASPSAEAARDATSDSITEPDAVPSSSSRELDEARDRARDRSMEHLRFEGTIGFLGGWARYADAGLSGPLPSEAFQEGVGEGTPIAGLRYDVRLVVAFVRMTIGADLAWSLFRAGDTTRSVVLDDGTQTLTDRAAFLWALRFGLGLELAASDEVRLFADVIGSVQFLELSSTVGETNVTSSVVSFAPGLRIGARVRVHDAFFVQLAADASPFGPWIAGDLSVGGAIE